jgi:hypothetical protein
MRSARQRCRGTRDVTRRMGEEGARRVVVELTTIYHIGGHGLSDRTGWRHRLRSG